RSRGVFEVDAANQRHHLRRLIIGSGVRANVRPVVADEPEGIVNLHQRSLPTRHAAGLHAQRAESLSPCGRLRLDFSRGGRHQPEEREYRRGEAQHQKSNSSLPPVEISSASRPIAVQLSPATSERKELPRETWPPSSSTQVESLQISSVEVS